MATNRAVWLRSPRHIVVVPILRRLRLLTGKGSERQKCSSGFRAYLRIARLFSLTGPYQDLASSFAVPDLLRQADRDGVVLLAGDGSAERSYCYATDLSIFLFKLLLGDPEYDAYNVGNRDATATTGEVAELISAIFGGLEVRRTMDAPAPLARRYVPQLDRMDEIWAPRVGLREGLLRVCHSLYNRGVITRKPVIPMEAVATP